MQNNIKNNYDLNKFINDLDLKNDLNIEEDLGNGFVRLKISEAERRQALQDIKSVEDIIIELLRNSRDAKSKNIFIATKKIAEKKRIIYFIDDGIGIPPKFHKLIFESRVTSKLENGIRDPYGFHGRGMALFSIRLNVDEIKITFSDYLKGTCLYLDLNLDKIPEKKDQSIMPQIVKSENGINLVGGVNNIFKVLIEFALQNKNINFFYGTPTQIVATIRDIFKKDQKLENYPKINNWVSFSNYISSNNINIMHILSIIEDYNLLSEITNKIFNMDISQRNIQRIIYDEIKPLEPLNEILFQEEKINSDKKVQLIKDVKPDSKLYDEQNLANRFKEDEIRGIIEAVEKEIIKLGNKYFITPDNNIELKRTNNTINIIINLKQKD
jgi:hypothetical protein